MAIACLKDSLIFFFLLFLHASTPGPASIVPFNNLLPETVQNFLSQLFFNKLIDFFNMSFNSDFGPDLRYFSVFVNDECRTDNAHVFSTIIFL